MVHRLFHHNNSSSASTHHEQRVEPAIASIGPAMGFLGWPSGLSFTGAGPAATYSAETPTSRRQEETHNIGQAQVSARVDLVDTENAIDSSSGERLPTYDEVEEEDGGPPSYQDTTGEALGDAISSTSPPQEQSHRVSVR